VIDFFTHNEGARQILDSFGICADDLSEKIKHLTGEMDRIFNEVADIVAPYAEAIAEIAVAAVITSLVGPLAIGMGLGTIPAAIASGMAGRIAGNLWSDRDWNYKVGDFDAMVMDGVFGVIVGVDGVADDWDDFARRGNNATRLADDVCSFTPDTTVQTPDGGVAIASIVDGDIILAYDDTSGVVGEHVVTNTFSHLDPVIVTLTISGEVIETTPEHPFYTVDEGWVAAGDLESGDQILSLTGDIGVVESVTFDTRDQVMYNLTVDSVHTFAVGDGAWVVHNTCHPVIDETLTNTKGKNITSQYTVDALEMFDIADEFLGPNYTVGM